MAAGGEGVATVTFGTAAGGHSVPYLTIGIHATSSDARIDALSVLADLGASALVVVQATAAVAVGEWIALVAGWARADGTSSHRLLATCSRSAWTARTSLGWGGRSGKRSVPSTGKQRLHEVRDGAGVVSYY